MKKLLILALLLTGCANTKQLEKPVAVKPKVQQECTDLTPEYLAEVKKHEDNLKSLSEYLEGQRTEMVAYFTVTLGRLSEISFKGKVFVNDYEMALVHAGVSQKGRHVGNLFMLVAQLTPGDWEIIGLFTSGEIRTQMEENKKKHLGEEPL